MSEETKKTVHPQYPKKIKTEVDELKNVIGDRDELDVLTRTGKFIQLGEKEIEIKPLVIRDSRIWRTKFIEKISLFAKQPLTPTNTEDVLKLFGTMFSEMPESLLELFYSYIKADDEMKEYIETNATDKQVCDGLVLCYENALSPFLSAMTKGFEVISQL